MTPPAKRRWRRWVVGLLAALALFTFGPLLWVRALGPGFVARTLEQRLGRPVVVEAVTGSWWERVEVTGIRVLDHSDFGGEVLARCQTATTDASLWTLFFSETPIRITLSGPEVTLRLDPAGRLNIASLGPSPEDAKPSATTDLSTRRSLEIEWTDGRAHFGRTGAAYEVEGAASFEAGLGSKASCRLEAKTATAGSLHLNGTWAPGNTVEARVSAKGVALEPWSGVVRRVLGISAVGRVDQLSLVVQGDPDRGFDVHGFARFDELSLGEGEQATGVLRQVTALGRGRLRAEAVLVDDLEVSSQEGHLVLKEPLRARREGSRWTVSGSLEAGASYGPALTRALGGLFPPWLSCRGALLADLEFNGNVMGEGDLTWGEPVAGLNASLRVQCERAVAGPAELGRGEVRFALSQGRPVLRSVVGTVEGGELRIDGVLDLLDDASPANLVWTLGELSARRSFQKEDRLLLVMEGGGTLKRRDGRFQIQGRAGVPHLLLERGEEALLHFTDMELLFDLQAPSDFSKVDIQGVDGHGDQGRLTMSRGRWDANSRRLVGEVTLELREKALVGRNLHPSLGFSSPLTASGSIDWVLDAWPPAACRGRWVAAAKNMTWRERPLTDVSASFEHDGLGVTLLEARVAVDAGVLEGRGLLHLPVSEAGDAFEIEARDVPFEGSITERHAVEGRARGRVLVAASASGEETATFDLSLDDVVLRQESTAALSSTSSFTLAGTAVRSLGAWGLRTCRANGTPLDLLVSVFESRASGERRLDAKVVGDGAWVEPWLALTLGEDARAKGPSRVAIAGTWNTDDPLASFRGTTSMSLPEASFGPWDCRELSGSWIRQDGRLECTDLRGVIGEGSFRAEGALAWEPSARRPGDTCTVELARLPVRFSTRGVLSREVRTRGELSGRLSASVDSSLNLQGSWTALTGRALRHVLSSGILLRTFPIPDLTAEGTFQGSAGQDSLTLPRTALRGLGVSLDVSGVHIGTSGFSVENWHASFGGGVLAPLSLELPEEFRIQGTLVSRGRLGVDWAPAVGGGFSLRGEAQVQVDSYALLDLLGTGFDGRFAFDGERASVVSLSTRLSGGDLSLASGSWVELASERRRFDASLSARGVHLRPAAGRVLTFLHPVFLVDPALGVAADVAGVLDGEIVLRGDARSASEWARSTQGEGRVKIAEGRIVGSTLLMALAVQTRDAFGQNDTGENSVGSRLGSLMAELAQRGFAFRGLETSFRVAGGQVASPGDLALKAPEMTLTVNGHAMLDGELSYRVVTDVLARLKARAQGTPEEAAVPASDSETLGARVTGNLLRVGRDGKPALAIELDISR